MPIAPEVFLKDVERFSMVILRDEGVYRHLRVSLHPTLCALGDFDLITWPGHLCFSGDRGTFVFARVSDMFEFFRAKDKSAANLFAHLPLDYWASKLQAVDKSDGATEFDAHAYRREITNYRRRLFLDVGPDLDKQQRADLWESFEAVLDASNEGEYAAVAAAHDWRFYAKPLGGRSLSLDTADFGPFKRHTDRFLWCCYAVRWAIQQYDCARQPAEDTVAPRLPILAL